MHLHHVKACLLCQQSRLAEPGNNLLNLLLRQPGDVGRNLLVQLFPQLIGGYFLHQHPGNILEHCHHVGIGLVQLGANLAVCIMGNFRQLLVEGKALVVKQGLFKFALAHRHVTNNNQGAATLGNGTDFCKIILVRQAKGGRRKNNAVFQLHSAIINRA